LPATLLLRLSSAESSVFVGVAEWLDDADVTAQHSIA
jgi:hypothetical protein